MKNVLYALLISTLFLLIPFTASFFVDGWLWAGFDYVFAWVVFSLVSLGITLVVKSPQPLAYKAATGIAMTTIFLLVWTNAAVGIIHNDNGSNLLYFAAIALGFMSAWIARCKPQGMAQVMSGIAIAVACIPVIGLFIWKEEMLAKPHGILGVFVLNSIFVGLFFVSAFLFRRAGDK